MNKKNIYLVILVLILVGVLAVFSLSNKNKSMDTASDMPVKTIKKPLSNSPSNQAPETRNSTSTTVIIKAT